MAVGGAMIVTPACVVGSALDGASLGTTSGVALACAAGGALLGFFAFVYADNHSSSTHSSYYATPSSTGDTGDHPRSDNDPDDEGRTSNEAEGAGESEEEDDELETISVGHSSRPSRPPADPEPRREKKCEWEEVCADEPKPCPDGEVCGTAVECWQRKRIQVCK
jgi:hypothetical protein